MGAKQSKRSVDIAGKEAEAAGEVAGAGAAGEGRVEALAEPDALKPQLNGDAHIHEETDKEKQLDSGTPENEKDATTEKQNKEADESEKDKESAPVTNGDAEPKPENGESPATDDAKKPKKEKVKKKWSLRSISFSRKDKPKQEKKQKEEEPKTNGEPEKVLEEAGEVTPENAVNEVAEEAKPESVKEEKTPETPVTEPLTNGSSTPESPKVESPAQETALAESVPQPVPEPEQLPVNGLSLEEPKPETHEAPKEESKPEEKQPTAETTEIAPAPEIPVKKEVCVEQMPLESPPPPLPANPPPSSVASFAATTMAPELTDASLANTAELVLSAPPTTTENSTIKPDTDTPEPSNVGINDDSSNTAAPTIELPVLKDAVEQILEEPNKSAIVVEQDQSHSEVANIHSEPIVESEVDPSIEKIEIEELTTELNVTSEMVDQQPAPVQEIPNNESDVTVDQSQEKNAIDDQDVEANVPKVIETTEVAPVGEVPDLELVENINGIETEMTKDVVALKQEISGIGDNTPPSMETPPPPESEKAEDNSESAADVFDNIEDLPPPPPLEDEVQPPKAEDTLESEVTKVHIDVDSLPAINGNHDALHNGDGALHADTAQHADTDADHSLTHMTKDTDAAALLATSAAPTEPQEPIPVSDKLADLIPEIPVVPDLNTETATETTTEVAVSN